MPVKSSFKKAADLLAAHYKRWQETNGRFKFAVGQELNLRDAQYEIDPEPLGWVVVGRGKGLCRDQYSIETDTEVRIYCKSYAEREFRAVGMPRRPERGAAPDAEANQL